MVIEQNEISEKRINEVISMTKEYFDFLCPTIDILDSHKRIVSKIEEMQSLLSGLWVSIWKEFDYYLKNHIHSVIVYLEMHRWNMFIWDKMIEHSLKEVRSFINSIILLKSWKWFDVKKLQNEINSIHKNTDVWDDWFQYLEQVILLNK